MMALGALALALSGFAALALAMDKHHRDLFGSPPPRGRAIALRAVGWVLLSMSLAASGASSGPSVGPVLWCGLMTVAAILVALVLTYGPSSRSRRKRAGAKPLRSAAGRR
ncbi:MAG: iron transporter [Rhodospirillaceae bacterium]|nr:iron transporter [Rhodospirillaceae bacterium]